MCIRDSYDAMKAAVEGGADVVVCAGYLQEAALKKAAIEYPETPFVFIDGYPLTDDAGNTLSNVAGIAFKEEQAGYLAGYAAVMDLSLIHIWPARWRAPHYRQSRCRWR